MCGPYLMSGTKYQSSNRIGCQSIGPISVAIGKQSSQERIRPFQIWYVFTIHEGRYNTADNRKTYNTNSTVQLSGNTFSIRDQMDVRSLAIEIAALTKRQQGVRDCGLLDVGRSPVPPISFCLILWGYL